MFLSVFGLKKILDAGEESNAEHGISAKCSVNECCGVQESRAEIRLK